VRIKDKGGRYTKRASSGRASWGERAGEKQEKSISRSKGLST